MKKNPSKSVFSKKNKTVSIIPESKKNSRIVKANSCIKIQSLNSEQNSKPTPSQTLSLNDKTHLSQRPTPNYSLPQPHFIDKPIPSNRNSVRNQGKMSTETIPMHERTQDSAMAVRLRERNDQLSKQNATLKQKCCDLQEMGVRDKQKIKNLIIRINEVKQSTLMSETKTVHPSTGKLVTISKAQLQIYNQNSTPQLVIRNRLQTPYKGLKQQKIGQQPCQNKECQQRKKYLQAELYKERITRDKLQLEKRQWQRNREELKHQYNQLLEEIREIRDGQY